MNSEVKSKQIILKPLITYKSSLLSPSKCYVIEVLRKANKHQIAKEFEVLFGKRPSKVNTTAIRNRKRRTKKGYVLKSDSKKAYIYADIELELFPKI